MQGATSVHAKEPEPAMLDGYGPIVAANRIRFSILGRNAPANGSLTSRQVVKPARIDAFVVDLWIPVLVAD